MTPGAPDPAPALDRAALGVPVAFETAHEAVVVKPAGVATELTSDPGGSSLLARVARAAPPGAEPRLPHRLDRVTRGFVLVALSADAVAAHNERIRAGAWSKWYVARLAPGGDPAGLLGEHRAYLKRVGRRAEVVRAGGKPSFLEVVATEPAPGRPGESHALIRLLTGRYHQIRAMLGALGAPLVGDALYGGPRGPLYLEHAGLRFRPFRAEGDATLFRRDDPDREPIEPALLDRLEAEL